MVLTVPLHRVNSHLIQLYAWCGTVKTVPYTNVFRYC